MNKEKDIYYEYLDCKRGQGFEIETLKITENSIDFIRTSEVSKNETEVFLDIRCPNGKIILFPGRNQFKNPEDSYSQYVNIFDNEGNNINFSNVIKIEKVKTSNSHLLIDTVLYSDISLYTNGLAKKEYNKFRFDKGFELQGADLLSFIIIKSKNNINKAEFIIKCNMLHKH